MAYVHRYEVDFRLVHPEKEIVESIGRISREVGVVSHEENGVELSDLFEGINSLGFKGVVVRDINYIDARTITDEELDETRKRERILNYSGACVSDIGLSAKVYGLLEEEKIKVLDQLVEERDIDLLAIRGFGKRSLEEVESKLDGLSLRLKVD